MTPDLKVIFNAFNYKENMHPEKQMMIYRMIQEMLTNAVKHARATGIILQCNQAEDVFFITMEDNGIGFDPQRVANKGIGLSNIRNRVAHLKGIMHIDSSNEGTVINIEVNIATPV